MSVDHVSHNYTAAAVVEYIRLPQKRTVVAAAANIEETWRRGQNPAKHSASLRFRGWPWVVYGYSSMRASPLSQPEW